MVYPPYDEDNGKARAEEILRKYEDALWRDAVMAEQEQIDAEVAGQRLSMKVSSLNTVATVAGLVVGCVTMTVLYIHMGQTRSEAAIIKTDAAAIREDTRMLTREIVSALKDLTQTQRESNCINTFPESQRAANVEMCKRMAR